MARIITITSGKGGVGKTSISLNLSLSLASKGCKVCLFDADLGLANVNILTGIYPKKDLVSVIDDQASLNDILIKDFQGIDIIPGSSGVERLADLKPEQTQRLIQGFLDLEDYDYFIFDTSAGISSQVLSFCMASHEIILVATCEPTSMTDAYSMLKTLSKHGYKNPVKILINQVKTGKAAKSTYAQLKETVKRFLKIKLEPLGIVGWDKSVRMAVISQTPFFMLFPNTLASKCIRTITEKLIAKGYHAADMPLEIFWDQCLGFFKQLQGPESKKTVVNNEAQHQKTQSKEPPQKTEETKKELMPNNLQIQQALFEIDSKLSDLMSQVSVVKQLLEGQKIKPKKEPVIPKTVRLKPKKIILNFKF